MRLGLAGLGAIGLALARRIDAGALPGVALAAVLSRDAEKTRRLLSDLIMPPPVVAGPEALAEAADIVVEAAPAAAFRPIAEAAIARGRLLVACSGGALLRQPDLVEAARMRGARILVPTGALGGLDVVRAAAEGRIDAALIETRKPPAAWRGAPYLETAGVSLEGLAAPLTLFEGDVLAAAAGFPANVNVAAALALAGIGPERTRVRLVADPALLRNVHHVEIRSDAAHVALTIEAMPDPDNPRTSRLTAFSVLACLRGLSGPLRIGS
ncbi:putative L-aspartate dehydrogenase [Aureimonas endophytica]|uniref:L-aspartate dehydrogenase n=1 Tax=Aureimonas endophytica TaxID=2027858 RepID=A0A916ZNY5_9HYPH|nr:aspartate dehydrogenase [Aureimonas endophytica]GGE05859.1 putative L-aspartate dehydrogenase [Aureimonas endophytica]